jgi:hypothetical protein
MSRLHSKLDSTGMGRYTDVGEYKFIRPSKHSAAERRATQIWHTLTERVTQPPVRMMRWGMLEVCAQAAARNQISTIQVMCELGLDLEVCLSWLLSVSLFVLSNVS